ncbi:hypothetical protein [Mesorhizobium sp.]|uniref:hypothetical protein n=1 Tax=Mesorhizobium sp. TaxID=1871066 RepID=UPI00120737C7|nr:hypothetical protein [Mesorhizobium sp.]TIS98970.1 MAG: hypothetical protein E5W87_23285 [Mesorhizobium sp.]
MASSIYRFVKQKLLSHGVRNTADGNLAITDRRLFLDFVCLERAVRLQDFATVQSAVVAIENRCLSMGKRHIVVFAYMYLRFSDATPKLTHLDIEPEEGGVRRTVDYRRRVSSTERLVGEWATVWYDRYSKSFFRALYESNSATAG